MRIFKNKREVALALGGGAVLGSAHIGVLKAIEELHIKVVAVSGTSVGALVGALFAFGKHWHEIEKIAMSLNWLDIASVTLTKGGILSNDKITKMMRKELGNVKIENSPIPLSMVAVDIVTGEKVVIVSGSVADGVRGSSCIPGVFAPVEMNGHLLVDGGVIENVPLSPHIDAGLKNIVGVDLISNIHFKKPKNVLDVLVNSLGIALKNATRLETRTADLMITPDLTGFNMIDSKQVPRLIEAGFNAAHPVLLEKFGEP